MKRFQLSTLMLLVVIAALGIALVIQQRRATRQQAELQALLAEAGAVVAEHYALGILSNTGNDVVLTRQKKVKEGARR